MLKVSEICSSLRCFLSQQWIPHPTLNICFAYLSVFMESVLKFSQEFMFSFTNCCLRTWIRSDIARKIYGRRHISWVFCKFREIWMKFKVVGCLSFSWFPRNFIAKREVVINDPLYTPVLNLSVIWLSLSFLPFLCLVNNFVGFMLLLKYFVLKGVSYLLPVK